MKMGTAARIARWGLMIAVIVILAYPAYTFVEEGVRDDSDILGVESEYDLHLMDAYDLADNLRSAIDKGATDIVYRDGSSAISEYNVDDVAKEVIGSGAPKARAVDSNGDTVIQTTIRYSSDFGTHVITGISLPGKVSDIIDPICRIRMIGDDTEFRVDSDSEAIDGRIVVRITVPYIIQATASALGCNMMLEVGFGYWFLFSASVSIDSGENTSAEFTHTGTEGSKTFSDRIHVESSIPVCKGTIGDATYTVTGSNGGSDITISGNRPISELLNESRNGEGGLEMVIGDKTYTLDENLSGTLIKSLARLEAM